jgi:2-keto-4-pentenoate hydratase
VTRPDRSPHAAHSAALPALFAAGLLAVASAPVSAQSDATCALGHWATDVVGAWKARRMISNASCYAELITDMDTARRMRDAVVTEFDAMFPRAAYKVVALDPINAALPGVDRPMVGMMYVGMFLANGAILPLESAELIITEPDFLVSVADERINDATTIAEAARYIDRIYAFIETLAPTFVNSPPNPYLMQASNLMARWGVIGDSIEASSDPAFIKSLETMTVTFRDSNGKVLATQPGSYLGENPLNGVLVVINELRRRGERLAPGDLISSGSYMPPIPVRDPIGYETVYEGLGGQMLRVSTSFR